MIVEETPPHPVAVAVKNNGEWFNPPTSHLDQSVTTYHPVHLAELGLKFYSKYLDDVETKFFDTKFNSSINTDGCAAGYRKR